MRRWLFRILVVVASLALLAIVAVQIVLWTGVPRSIVVGSIEKELGLRATAASVSTGWFGRTTLRNVTLSLPLAKKSFVSVPVMRVTHRWLLGLVFASDINIARIELDRPELFVTQDATGRWNLAEVAALVGRAVGGQSAVQSSGSDSPQWPAVRVENAKVALTDSAGRATSVEPVNIDGAPDSSVSWKGELTVPGHVQLSIHLAPGVFWGHSVSADVHDVAEWVRPWIAQFPPAATVRAGWNGQVSGGQVSGRLVLDDLSAAGINASGAVAVTATDSSLTLSPESLRITTSHKLIPEARLVGGKLVGADGTLRAQDLLAIVYGGPAKLDGWFNLATATGSLQAAWDKLVVPVAGKNQVQHSGTLQVSLARPFPTEMRIEGSLFSYGTMPGGPWTARANFGAAGADWTNLEWHARAEELTWKRPQPVILNGLELGGDIRPVQRPGKSPTCVATLRSARRSGDAKLGGWVWYDFATDCWAMRFAGDHWPLHPIEGVELSFQAAGHGDLKSAQLEDFRLREGSDAELRARGEYAYHVPKPVSLTVNVHNLQPAMESRTAKPNLLGGTLEGDAVLLGTLIPLNLDVIGTLTGQKAFFRDHPIGDFALGLSGSVDPERADIKTETLKLLGGRWDIEAFYAFNTLALDVGVKVSELPLENVADLLHRQDFAGTLDGRWHLFAPGLRFDPARIRFTGNSTITNARGPALIAADQIDFETELANGTLNIAPINLRRGDYGRGLAQISLKMDNASRIESALSLTAWPLSAPGSPGELDLFFTAPKVIVQLPDRNAAAPEPKHLQVDAENITLHANAVMNKQIVGTADFSAAVKKSIIDLHDIHAGVLDGSINGNAAINLGHFDQSTGDLRWKQLDNAVLADFIPSLHGLGGRFSGSAQLRPAAMEHPLEPVLLSANGTWTDGSFRAVRLNDITLNVFLDADPGEGIGRIVLADNPARPNMIHMADGMVSLWGRMSRYRFQDPSQGQLTSNASGDDSMISTQGNIAFSQLDLDQIIRSIKEKGPPTLGRLSGEFMILGSSTPRPLTHSASAASKPRQTGLQGLLSHLYGEFHVKLIQANIGKLPVISTLYNLMHLGANADKPTGNGEVFARLESGTLNVTNLRYFNRGTEVRVLATIENLWEGANSPIQGTAVGSVRPLSEIKLPLFPDVDKLLSVIQTNAYAVKISGPIGKPGVRVIPFADLGEGMQQFLLGDVRSETRTTAGP